MSDFPVLITERERKQYNEALPKLLPIDFVKKHREQIEKNHGQTIERIAERGGLHPVELMLAIRERGINSGEQFSTLESVEFVNAELIKWLQSQLAAANERVAELIKDNADVASLNGDLVIENRKLREALETIVETANPTARFKNGHIHGLRHIAEQALKESPDG